MHLLLFRMLLRAFLSYLETDFITDFSTFTLVGVEIVISGVFIHHPTTRASSARPSICSTSSSNRRRHVGLCGIDCRAATTIAVADQTSLLRFWLRTQTQLCPRPVRVAPLRWCCHQRQCPTLLIHARDCPADVCRRPLPVQRSGQKIPVA